MSNKDFWWKAQQLPDSIVESLKSYIDSGSSGSSSSTASVPAYLASTYGAKFDGSTSDSVAIQAAIDACNAAGGGIAVIDHGFDNQGHGSYVVAAIDVSRADAAVQASCVGDGVGGISMYGRYTDATHYIILYTNGLRENTGSGEVVLVGATFNWTAGNVVKLVCSGSTALVYKDGTLVATARTSVTTGTKFGLGTQVAGDQWDVFSIS